MPYSAGSDAWVPLRISSTDTTGREGSALHESRSWMHQEPPSNMHRMKVRTRKPDKSSGERDSASRKNSHKLWPVKYPLSNPGVENKAKAAWAPPVLRFLAGVSAGSKAFM